MKQPKTCKNMTLDLFSQFHNTALHIFKWKNTCDEGPFLKKVVLYSTVGINWITVGGFLADYAGLISFEAIGEKVKITLIGCSAK